MNENALVQVKQLKIYFPTRAGSFLNRTTGYIKAVDGISLEIRKGETLGLVGESGCGKSTAGRAILQLYRPTGGEVIFRGSDLARQSAPELRRSRPRPGSRWRSPWPRRCRCS